MMSDKPQNMDDGRLSAVYRAAPADEPPAALDDAIRAAARREVGSRPRAADKPFYMRWQMPLSAAAVLVLCVSLITVMRDEGGALTQVPRADAPGPAAGADRAAEAGSVVSKVELAPEASRAKSIGLKQPGYSADGPVAGADPYSLAVPGGGIGMRPRGTAPEEARRGAEPAVADALPRRPALPPSTDKGNIASADAVANNAVKSDGRRDMPREAAQASSVPETRGELQAAAPPAQVSKRAEALETGKVLRQQLAATDQLEREARPASSPAAAAVRAEPMAVAAPAARIAEKSGKETAAAVDEMARLAPDKWLARIEELRQAGRLEEARAGLAEFRRRYPDFALPATLRDGIQR